MTTLQTQSPSLATSESAAASRETLDAALQEGLDSGTCNRQIGEIMEVAFASMKDA